MIQTQGAVIGQINSLVVYEVAHFSFGRPSKVTCQVRIGKGEIVVISDKAAEIAVYNMTGMVVLKAQIAEGNNTISLPAGIYIVNGMKTIVF